LWQSLDVQGRAEEAAQVNTAFSSAWQDADVQLIRSRF